MNRRSWLKQFAGLVAGILGFSLSRGAEAAEPEVDLKAMRKQLEQGLRVTTDAQRAYIDRVVTLVGQKKLSATLVYALFKWARKRYPRFPFIYFRRALDLMAKKQGLTI